mgnify:CR=1 FL=1
MFQYVQRVTTSAGDFSLSYYENLTLATAAFLLSATLCILNAIALSHCCWLHKGDTRLTRYDRCMAMTVVFGFFCGVFCASFSFAASIICTIYLQDNHQVLFGHAVRFAELCAHC